MQSLFLSLKFYYKGLFSPERHPGEDPEPRKGWLYFVFNGVFAFLKDQGLTFILKDE